MEGLGCSVKVPRCIQKFEYILHVNKAPNGSVFQTRIKDDIGKIKEAI